jgi:hypothetical protein
MVCVERISFGPLNNKFEAGHQWFTPVILATQEVEIRRIEVESQPGQIVCETLSRKYPTPKRTGGILKW